MVDRTKDACDLPPGESCTAHEMPGQGSWGSTRTHWNMYVLSESNVTVDIESRMHAALCNTSTAVLCRRHSQLLNLPFLPAPHQLPLYAGAAAAGHASAWHRLPHYQGVAFAAIACIRSDADVLDAAGMWQLQQE